MPLDSTLDSAAARQQLLTKAREATVKIRRLGIDLSAYNTNENADDVNDLRVALGAQKIIIWGHVFGQQHFQGRFQWIQKLGHVIKIRHKKLLHIGDADAAVENFAA